MLVKVYEPCSMCSGTGRRPIGTRMPKTTGDTFVYEWCVICSGTGKGKIREIREEGERD